MERERVAAEEREREAAIEQARREAEEEEARRSCTPGAAALSWDASTTCAATRPSGAPDSRGAGGCPQEAGGGGGAEAGARAPKGARERRGRRERGALWDVPATRLRRAVSQAREKELEEKEALARLAAREQAGKWAPNHLERTRLHDVACEMAGRQVVGGGRRRRGAPRPADGQGGRRRQAGAVNGVSSHVQLRTGARRRQVRGQAEAGGARAPRRRRAAAAV